MPSRIRHLSLVIPLAISLAACDRTTPTPTPAPTATQSTAAVPSAPEAAAMPTTTTPFAEPAPESPDQKYNGLNTRSIGQAAYVWSTKHAKHLPDSLAQLLLANAITPEQLLCKPSTTAPLPLTPETLEKAKSDPATFAKDVDTHSDFLYFGTGRISQTDSAFIILCQKPSPATADGFVLGYEDGHSELIPLDHLTAAFEYTNYQLRKAHKPPIDTTTLLDPPTANP